MSCLKRLQRAFTSFDDKSVVCIVLIAFCLRFYHLGYQSLWLDEFLTLSLSNFDNPIDLIKAHYYRPDSIPPGYYMIVGFLVKLFGDSEFVLRFPSAICGVLSVILMYYICKMWGLGKKVSIMSSTFMALSGALVYYSQEARANSLTVFFSLALFFIYIKREKEGRLERSWKLVSILNVVLLSVTHYIGFAFFLYLSFLVFVKGLIQKKYAVKGLLFFLIPLSVMIPWMTSFKNRAFFFKGIYGYKVNLFDYFYKLYNFSFNYESYWASGFKLVMPSVLQGVNLSLLLITVLFCVHGFIKREKSDVVVKRDVEQLLVLILFFIVPVLFVFLNDKFIGLDKYYRERNFLFVLPFLYIFMGYIINFIKLKFIKNIIFASWILFFIFTSFINVNYYFSPFKTQGKELALQVVKKYPEINEIYYICGPKISYSYYLNRFGKRPTLNPIGDLRAFEKKKLNNFLLLVIGCFPNELQWGEIEIKYKVESVIAYPSHAGAFLFKLKKDNLNFNKLD